MRKLYLNMILACYYKLYMIKPKHTIFSLYGLIALLYFSSISIVMAQSDLNHFKKISVSNEFSLNPTIDVVQDNKGLIWIGTRQGLIKFDGIQTELLDLVLDDGTRPNDIIDIYADAKNRLWVSTSKTLLVYELKSNKIRAFPLERANEKPAILLSAATCITELRSGEIWIGSKNGLTMHDPATGQNTQIFHDPDNEYSLSSSHILSIYESKIDSSIWIGTSNGLNKLIAQEDGNFKFKHFKNDPFNKKSITDNVINTMIEDDKGALWIGTNDGLDVYYGKNSEFQHFSKKYDFTNNVIRALTIDDQNRVWAGTYDGISVVDTNNHIHHIKHDPYNSNSLSDNKIKSLFTDNNGTVWVGTYYGGVSYWDRRYYNFNKIDERQLSYKVVSSIVEDQNQNLYFGTEGGGISVLNTKDGTYSYLNHLDSDFSIGTVKSMKLKGNDLWIGTYNQGLIYYNLETGKYKSCLDKDQLNKSSDISRILSIETLGDSIVWVGTLSESLKIYNRKTDRFRSIPGLDGQGIRAMIFDRNKNLWFVSSRRLSIISRKSILNETYESNDIPLPQVPDVNFQDLLQDKKGQLWAASLSGLFRLEEGRLNLVPLGGNYSIYSIVEDKTGVLWLSAKSGIVRFDPASGETTLFDKDDGVHINEFSRSAGIVSSAGNVYLAGASGINTFKPTNTAILNKYVPNVVITEFRLFDEPVYAGDSTGILESVIEYEDHIYLDYDQNIFTLNFALPNYIKSGKNAYRYRLKGLDDQWYKTSTPSVSYTLQRGGDYTFEVSGINSDGFQTEELTTLGITVSNPPWRRWWAFCLYAVILVGMLSGLIYILLSRIRLRHKLESEQKELLNQEKTNQQKLQFFTNISHEFRTPLTLIMGPLQKIIDEYKGSSQVFRQLLVIKKNTDQLFKLINELMDFRKLENKQMQLQAAEGNIVRFVREIYLSFLQQAKANKYDYTFDAETDNIDVYFDRDKLEKVIYNLISNAFKYTPKKGEISISVKKKDASVDIIVRDNGDGIRSDQLNKVFDRFYEIPEQNKYGKYSQGSGIGLAIAKNIVDLHKGTLAVQSVYGDGTDFTVTLPLGKGHLSDDEVIKEFKNSEDIAQYYAVNGSSAGNLVVDNIDVTFENTPDAEKKTILVVEDNEEVGKFIKSVLIDKFNVILERNGREGYHRAKSELPDLIISDLMMPEMDGVEFCSKIKSDINTSHIPFILLTARTSLVYKYDGLESGADEYLSKPFDIKELLLKCKNIIGTHDKLKARFGELDPRFPIDSGQNSMDEKLMHRAIQIVKENISNEFFNVQLFCNELGISRSLLFSKFKVWTNQTPNEYILGIRMKHAAHLIELNKYNISQVSYHVGFKDPNYFSKCFKKYFSLSPKAYSEKFMNTTSSA